MFPFMFYIIPQSSSLKKTDRQKERKKLERKKEWKEAMDKMVGGREKERENEKEKENQSGRENEGE